MIASAAMSFATTVFGYFSPTKSPYYAVIVFGTVAATILMDANEINWIFGFVPVALTLLISSALAFRSKPDFTAKEYNDQLKFARSFGVSSALLCLALAVAMIEPETSDGRTENRFEYLLAYGASLVHIILFLSYIFVFHNFNARRRGVNFVQISLITSTYLIGVTYVAIHYSPDNEHHRNTIIVLWGLWLMCGLYLGKYLFSNIKFAIPQDAEYVEIEEKSLSDGLLNTDTEKHTEIDHNKDKTKLPPSTQ
ncbi:MAG: hypothetical protein OQK24_00745 [Magnetovibrio sp.]|nr:hypothetical protein [Magnetovibrio sp.]